MRRTTRLQERLTPCQCCNYPISERHHLLEYAEFGETRYTRQLCANCHELFHIIDKAFTDFEQSDNPDTRAVALLDAIGRTWGKDDSRIVYLCQLVSLTRKGRQEERGNRRIAGVFEAFFGG